MPTIMEYSSDSIWYKEDSDYCLSTYLDELEESKADKYHTHNGYSPSNHEHDDYSLVGHIHSYNDLADKPEAVTIPDSLPANGGNADTIDGKHASEFASTSDIVQLQNLVGDTAVSTQISAAVVTKANTVHTHVMDDIAGLADELSSKYEQPTTGVPKSDLSADVQISLGKADTAIQSLSGYATESYVGTAISGKVDAVDGKGLSTNDYTTAEKTKLDNIEPEANKTIVDSALSDTSTNPVQNKVVKSAVDALSELVGDSAVSTQISDAVATTLSNANEYTDTKIANLINGAPATMDTLKEISDILNDNADVVEALETAVGSKASAADLTAHTTNKSNPHGVTKAQIGLGNVENKSSATIRGEITKENVTTALGYTPPTTNTTYAKATSSADGLMSAVDKSKLDGISTGATKVVVDSALSATSTNPVQNKVVHTAINNLNTLVGDTAVSTQITNAIADKSDTNHTHSQYVNQNAFANIAVGSTTVAADSVTDTINLVAGNNVSITANATNDTITIAATDTIYTHPTTSGNKHIPSGGSSGQILRWSANGTAVWGADNNTTYSEATTSAAGLMSAADKAKLNGIATGANKTTVDSSLSSTSTNPVQNKVVNTAISNLNARVGDTAVSTQINNAVSNIKLTVNSDGVLMLSV